MVNVVLDIPGRRNTFWDIAAMKPEELKLMQEFPKDYIIDRDYNWKPYPIARNGWRRDPGTVWCRLWRKRVSRSQLYYLKVGERVPNLNINDSREQLNLRE